MGSASPSARRRICMGLLGPRMYVLAVWLALVAATILPSTSASSSLAFKAEMCAQDLDESRAALDLVTVTPERAPPLYSSGAAQYPRVLCFVITYSAHHATKVRAVAETWGQRCDKLLFFSNQTDLIVVGAGTPAERAFDVVALDGVADHDHLWQKTKDAVRYLHSHFRNDYDWFYKADDDAYVVMENLRNYLKRPEIVNTFNREPMQLGHRLNLGESAVNYYIKNETVRELWHSRWDRWVYNSGGPGYAMNRLYLDKFRETLYDSTCLTGPESETSPEDAGISFCMMWHGVEPWNTRDHRGRERWHAYSPRNIFLLPGVEDPNNWYVQYHRHIGGVRPQQDSAAPDSVAFHYISQPLMYFVERSLYFCRTGDDVPDVATFNSKYNLALSDKVMPSEA